MNNPLLLLLLPVVAGLLLLLVIRSERRQRFVQQRLDTLTAGNDEPDPPSLVRILHRAPSVLYQLPRKLVARLDIAFEATGNRIGPLHLTIAGLGSAIIVIGFTSRVLGLNSPSATLLGLVAAGAAPVVLLRLGQSHYRRRFLDVFPDGLDLVRRAVKAGLPVNEALAV